MICLYIFDELSSHQEKKELEWKKLSSFEAQNLVKVSDLTPRSRNISIRVRVLEKNEPKVVYSRTTGEQHRVAEALVGDDTGVILMSLWNDSIDEVEVNETYYIDNARITLFNESMRLSVARGGKIFKSKEDIAEESIDRNNNMSQKRYERRRRYW